MDPVTAFAQVVTAVAAMITEIVKGQTPEQKKQLWDWYLADVKVWRTLFHLDP